MSKNENVICPKCGENAALVKTVQNKRIWVCHKCQFKIERVYI